MPRRNRVDPFGDLHAVPDRGMLMGNRGVLVDDHRALVKHHSGNMWISCVTSYRDWRSPLDQPHHWTPLFFLDEAVALAAGHRPCGLCRREAHLRYRDAITSGLGLGGPIKADELNRRLAAERLRRGRGLDRTADRRTWKLDAEAVPDGAVVLLEGRPHLIWSRRVHGFSFSGWTDAGRRPEEGALEVLTPATSTLALQHGYSPLMHPSAVSPRR
jgi:hypothetical protein